MNNKPIHTLLALALAATPIAAQPASSSQHFLASSERGSGGGTALTNQYRLTATIGPSPAAERAFSGNYSLQGGFCAGLDVVVPGRPWLTAVTPRFVTMGGGAPVTVHGTELNLGGMVSLTVGGVAATVQTRTNGAIGTTLPPQPAPGWLPVEITTTAGTATLAHGAGVLPLIEAVDPVQHEQPGELIYRGRTGDTMVWAYALSRSTPPLPIPPLRHGLLLGLAGLNVTNAVAVTDPSGELRLSLPPLRAATPPIYVQAVTLSTDPGLRARHVHERDPVVLRRRKMRRQAPYRSLVGSPAARRRPSNADARSSSARPSRNTSAVIVNSDP